MQTSDTLPLGTILNSGIRKYEILSVLGQGGFGITYLAKSEVLVDNIPVEAFFAIKEHYISKMNEREGMSVVISNENNRDEINESIDSFITEAKRLNKLSLHHPGIVRVNENFKANDTAYYVMEYIKGSSVRKHTRQTKTKKLCENDALQLFRLIAETIGYLHKNKVTHLDIKPDNILIIEIKQFIDGHIEARFADKSTTGTKISLSDGENYDETVFTGQYDGFINEELAVLLDNPNEFVEYLQQNPGCVVRYLLVGKGSPTPYGLDLQHGERLKDLSEW